ncbi:MAG: glycosyltransferase family A protein [Nitrospinaceae bacterium]|jgi:glycosyltransferase involved in cell wall biosynthesis|nr:glycosyltransferase family A protein [Nitrospinaceae bacterium]
MEARTQKSNESDSTVANMPAVSIVVPTHNRAERLGETLRSVFNQTCQDFELIVVDDGSTDDTQKVVNSFPRVQYISKQENHGVSRARNEGLALAKGRYICFLDSDDLWDEKKLQIQMQWMGDNPNCQVCYTDEIWIRKGVRVNQMNKHRKYSGDIFRHCLPLCIVSPSSAMLRAELFDEIGNFDESLPACEDYDLWLRIAEKYPFHFIEEPLIIKQGGHADQLSRKYWGMDRFRVAALQKLLDRNSLEGERLQLTRATLLEKCSVLIQGFVKRGKKEDELHYRALVEKYSF